MLRPLLTLAVCTAGLLFFSNDVYAQSFESISSPPDLLDPQSVRTADLDGDADADVLVATRERIAWYENQLDTQGSFSAQHTVADDINFGQSVRAADLDGDGDLDLLSTAFYDASVAWYENRGDGTFSAPRVIATQKGASPAHITDLDGDGDPDVIVSFGTASEPAEVVWYENNLDVDDTFAPAASIDANLQYSEGVYAADLDGDDDPDVLAIATTPDAPNEWKIIRYANELDENGGFGAPQVINTASGFRAIHAADLDDDGDADLLASNVSEVLWFENELDAGGAFAAGRVVVQDTKVASITTVDLDGDGDLDVAFGDTFNTEEPSVEWCENRLDSDGAFARHAVTMDATFAGSVAAADLDDDGASDLLSASYGDEKVAWYKNEIDQGGGFGDQQIISTKADGASSVSTADLDGDGDPDVLSASYSDDKIAWYENKIDTEGTFGEQQIISTEAIGAQEVVAADFDGDGDLDVASASTASSIHEDDKIAWYENRMNTEGDFGPQRIISTNFEALSLHAVDLDGDGDPDILSASTDPDKIAWYENRLDTDGTFGDEHILSTDIDNSRSVFAADFDGDGDLDVLSTSSNDREVAWYENKLNENGTFGPPQTVTDDIGNAYAVYATDLDGDEAVDVIAGSNRGVFWMQNTIDETGTFNDSHTITSGMDEVVSVFASDLDGDSAPDVLFVSQSLGQLAWYRNERALPVEHAQVSAQATEHEIRLSWTTASTVGNNGFAVERSIDSGSTFQQIGYVEAGTDEQNYQFVDTDFPTTARSLTYRLCQTDMDGVKTCSSSVVVERSLPQDLALQHNFPNPFSERTTIHYTLPEEAHVRLAIYNALGQRVKMLIDEHQRAGRQEVILDGHPFPSGRYFVQLLVESQRLTQPLTIVR